MKHSVAIKNIKNLIDLSERILKEQAMQLARLNKDIAQAIDYQTETTEKIDSLKQSLAVLESSSKMESYTLSVNEMPCSHHVLVSEGCCRQCHINKNTKPSDTKA